MCNLHSNLNLNASLPKTAWCNSWYICCCLPTWFGSPPKKWIFSSTHLSANTWSLKPCNHLFESKFHCFEDIQQKALKSHLISPYLVSRNKVAIKREETKQVKPWTFKVSLQAQFDLWNLVHYLFLPPSALHAMQIFWHQEPVVNGHKENILINEKATLFRSKPPS